MRPRVQLALLGLWLLVSVAWCVARSNARGATALEFSPGQYIQMGRVATGRHMVKWRIVNSGSAPIRVVNASGTCSCAVVRVPIAEIAPRQELCCAAEVAVSAEGPFSSAVFLDWEGSSRTRDVVVIVGIGVRSESAPRFLTEPVMLADVVPGAVIRRSIAAVLPGSSVSAELKALRFTWSVIGSRKARVAEERAITDGPVRLEALLLVDGLNQGEAARGIIAVAGADGQLVVSQQFRIMASTVVTFEPGSLSVRRALDASVAAELRWSQGWDPVGFDGPEWVDVQWGTDRPEALRVRIREIPPADVFTFALRGSARRGEERAVFDEVVILDPAGNEVEGR